jgi:Uma2 family endonuclease
MATSKRRATYDDLLKLPEHVVGEIIHGELIVSPRPALPHAAASSGAGSDVHVNFHGPPGRGPGGWWILFEPELHFGQDVLVPDLAGWRQERMPKIRNIPAVELPPDWICEVVSPSTERIDRARKMGIYARVKVPHLWLINPLSRTVEVYLLEGAAWKLVATHEGDARVRIHPFEAIELDLSRWWIESESPAEAG